MNQITQTTAAGGQAVDLHARIDRLLNPASVAIVGAQPEPNSIGGGVLSNLERFGYGGAIHLVSRSKDEIRGRACVKTIDDLPQGIDVAILIVPQAAIMDSVAACARRGIAGVIIFTSGFAEAGEEGRAAQDALAALCAQHGITFLGPNCMGYANFIAGIPLTFEPIDVHRLEAGAKGIAIVAQSGATAGNLRLAMHGRGLNVTHTIATGNEAQLGAEHFTDYLLDQPTTSAIGVYVEQIRDPALFLSAARKARARKIPIVLLHPGASEKGQEAAQSHTGALAGDHAVMQTILRAEAVAVVSTTEEMFDVLAILSRFPTPAPGGAAVVTNSGAIRGLAFDFAEAVGLELAQIPAEGMAKLQALVPDYIHADNPFDIGTIGFSAPKIYDTATRVLLEEDSVGMILHSHAPGSAHLQLVKSDNLIPAYRDATKPVLFNLVGDDYPLDDKFMADVRAAGIPFFRSPERAMRAMVIVADYAKALAAAAKPVAAPTNVPAISGTGTIPEYQGKDILRAMGLKTPEGGMAKTADEAVAVANRIGYPVVIKIQAAELAHKSDVGGVIVGLRDDDALRAGWDKLIANVTKARPDVTPDGVLVESMAASGLEMVVGARRDPQWGPVVLVGLGGVWIEALNDARLLPAATTREAVIAELGKLNAHKLLGEFRGQPARDVAAIADVVVQLGAVMRADPKIVEVDINPLVVGAEGQGAIALDALFVRD